MTVKPAKPYDDFPLFAHATGRWCKKINGTHRYFGPWDDPDKALRRYLREKDCIYTQRRSRATFSRPKNKPSMRCKNCKFPRGKSKHAKFCSGRCKTQYAKAHPSSTVSYCEACYCSFDKLAERHKFCSDRCCRYYKKRHYGSSCLYCHKHFFGALTAKFCSSTCLRLYYESLIVICKFCQKPFSGKSGKSEYCSHRCGSSHKRQTLADSYVTGLLRRHAPIKRPPAILIEVKRLQITIMRMLKHAENND
jgi:hypothetical protein